MRIENICNIASAKIPQQTPEFSDAQSATITIATGVVTVTSTAHGLTVGKFFTLSGFDVEADGIENDVINYRQEVATVIDADNFTFTILQEFVSSTDVPGTLHTNIRIFGTASAKLAIDAYAKIANGQYAKALYVIDLGEVTSKDRSVGNDADFQQTNTTDFKMTFINNFGILAFLPIKNDTAGASTSDFARQLLSFMVRALVGRRLTTDWESKESTGITFTSSNRQVSNNSYIVQNYAFESVEILSSADINQDTFGYNINDIRLVVEPKIGD